MLGDEAIWRGWVSQREPVREESQPTSLTGGIVMAKADPDGNFTIGEFTLYIFVAAGFAAVLIALSEVSRLLFPTLPLILHGMSLGFVIFMIFGFAAMEHEAAIKPFKSEGGEILVSLLIMGTLAASIMFGLFCRELYFELNAGFMGQTSSNHLEWVGFGLDILFEAVFLDAPAMYELNMSDIHTPSFWTRSLVFLFRLTVDFILIRALIRYWGILRTVVLRRSS